MSFPPNDVVSNNSPCVHFPKFNFIVLLSENCRSFLLLAVVHHHLFPNHHYSLQIYFNKTRYSLASKYMKLHLVINLSTRIITFHFRMCQCRCDNFSIESSHSSGVCRPKALATKLLENFLDGSIIPSWRGSFISFLTWENGTSMISWYILPAPPQLKQEQTSSTSFLNTLMSLKLSAAAPAS